MSDSSKGTVTPASRHDTADWFEQRAHRFRFGWGPNGLRRLAPGADVVVVVDVLSFSTAVDVALGRRAVILPYRWHDGTEGEFAAANDATVASKVARPGHWSLRPSSLAEVPAGTRLVLPSPNGSALTFAAEEAGAGVVLVGSIRNATAVGRSAAGHQTVTVIAAGERWRGTTGPLRPAIEDLIGAGAILSAAVQAAGFAAGGTPGGVSPDQIRPDPVSPEARVAMAAFVDAHPRLTERLQAGGAGLELIDKGFPADVLLASALDASTVVPTLRGVELVDGR